MKTKINTKTHALLEKDMGYLANLMYDATLNKLQYFTGNRVIQSQPRLTHDQRKLVVDEYGKPCTMTHIHRYWLIDSGAVWIRSFFKGPIPGRFDDVMEALRVGDHTFLDKALKAFEELTLDDLFDNGSWLRMKLE